MEQTAKNETHVGVVSTCKHVQFDAQQQHDGVSGRRLPRGVRVARFARFSGVEGVAHWAATQPNSHTLKFVRDEGFENNNNARRKLARTLRDVGRDTQTHRHTDTDTQIQTHRYRDRDRDTETHTHTRARWSWAAAGSPGSTWFPAHRWRPGPQFPGGRWSRRFHGGKTTPVSLRTCGTSASPRAAPCPTPCTRRTTTPRGSCWCGCSTHTATAPGVRHAHA